MAEIFVDCVNGTCPVPLIETRKAINKAKKGDIIEVQGTHPSSKKEIPMAVEAMKLKIIDTSEENGIWKIKIRK